MILLTVFVFLVTVVSSTFTDGWIDVDEPFDFAPTATQRLQRYLIRRRGPDIVKPKRNGSLPVDVKFKVELYQIIELNERQQYVTVSVWVIERWYDELLYWNPEEYDNISETKLHYTQLWIPDTTLYNTLLMKDDEQRRPQHVKLTTDYANKRALVEFLYPAIYKFYCRLYLQFFPFDSQTCKMIFGSWTSDNRDIDYFSLKQEIGTSNYMPNEGWSLQGTSAQRNVVKYVCCAYNYTLLDFTLYLRRRPLFYLVNLVIPTFIITLIAITGFFTTSSASGVRVEKISLCISTLLSMSILMLMISDQMPSTSTFIPLISWFYMCAIVIISVGALAASFVISVQKFGSVGQRLPPRAVVITRLFSSLSLTRIPDHLQPNDKLLEFARLYGISPETFKFGEFDSASRKSTITQFAKFVFTAGTEGYPPPAASGNCCPPSDTFNKRKDGRQPMEDIPEKNENSHEFRSRMKSTQSETGEGERTWVEEPTDINSFSTLPSTRRLARIEYDWVATVIERCTFLVFLFTFLLVSLGINSVGLIHWVNSSPPPEAVPVTALQ